jgi:hypothetical protein
MKYFKLVTVSNKPSIVIMNHNQLEELGRFRKETRAEQIIYVSVYDNTIFWLIEEISYEEMIKYQADDHLCEIANLWYHNVETPAERYERYQQAEEEKQRGE